MTILARPPRPKPMFSAMPRSVLTAGMIAILMATGGGAVATAQPSTIPAAPTTTAAPQVLQQQAPAPVDPCATTTPPTSTTTAPPTTTTTTVPATCTTAPSAPAVSPTAAPAAPAPATTTATAPAPAPAPAPELAPAQLPAEPAAVEPVAPTDDELSSKTAEPDPDYTPTEDPNATVVPGEMRSDREEIPAPFTKEDADKAETMEARQRMSRAAVGCQTYWPSPYEVCGAIRDKYNSLGGPGSFLSYPYSPEYTSNDGVGKRTLFLNGPIYWSPAGGAHPVVNSFLNRWGVHRYEEGFLGYPTTDEIVHPDAIGRRQEFMGGAIYVAFQNAIGSAIANGPIRDKWNSLGGHTGWLGYLTSDELSVGTTKYYNFVGGVIYDTAFDEPRAVSSIETVAASQPSGDKCVYVDLQSGQCVRNSSFEGALEDMEQCLYPALRDPDDENWSDSTVIAIIKSPNASEPELILTCGTYKDHIVPRHDADEDPENFLACLGLVYNLGYSDTATGKDNAAKSWVNPETGVKSTVVWSKSTPPKPQELIVTAYAGPYNEAAGAMGNDWGHCGEGYIEDRPRP